MISEQICVKNKQLWIYCVILNSLGTHMTVRKLILLNTWLNRHSCHLTLESFSNNQVRSIKESRVIQPLHSCFIYMQCICCNKTILCIDPAWKPVQQMSYLSSRLLLLTCLPVCSLFVSGPGLPSSLHDELVANKQTLAPVLGRQRGHRAAGQNSEDAE